MAKRDFAFGKENFILIAVAVAVIAIGFMLMSGGGSQDPTGFNPEIFSSRRIVVAPFGIQGEENLAFTIVVHVATVFSTLVILWKEIEWIFRGLFKFKMNAETRYVINILISMIPIGIVGVFFKDTVEDIFG